MRGIVVNVENVIEIRVSLLTDGERQPGSGVHSNKVAHNAVVYPHNSTKEKTNSIEFVFFHFGGDAGS